MPDWRLVMSDRQCDAALMTATLTARCTFLLAVILTSSRSGAFVGWGSGPLRLVFVRATGRRWLTMLGAIAAVVFGVSAETASAGAQLVWTKPAQLDHQSLKVTCPAVSLCVAWDADGSVWTSRRPMDGASSWSVAHIDGPGKYFWLRCPSASLCVASDIQGELFTSSDPAGGARSWSAADLGRGKALSSIDCPSARVCVGDDAGGNLLTSTDPTGGASAWEETSLGTQLFGSTCASTGLCLAYDADGNIASSTNPTAGASTWTFVHADSAVPSDCGHYYPGYDCEPRIDDISCQSTSLCLAGDGEGNVLTSVNPASPNATWTMKNLDPASPSFESLQVACPLIVLCVAKRDYGSTAWSTDARGAGASAWTVDASPAGDGLISMTCPSATFCGYYSNETSVARVATTTNPMSDPTRWTTTKVDTSDLTTLACPSASLCVAADSTGNAIAGAEPPTIAQIKSSLRKQIVASTPKSAIRRLLTARSYRSRVSAVITGRLRVSWYLHVRRDGRAHPRLVKLATGLLIYSSLAPATITVTPTRKIKRLTRTTHRLHLIATATFTTTTGRSLTATRNLVAAH
jgi:hypothetical protein